MKKLILILYIVILILAAHIFAEDISGEWHAKVKKEKVRLRIRINRQGECDWDTCNWFKTNDFKGLGSNGSQTFKLKREAGTINFSGSFSEGRGSGTFVFQPDATFLNFLAKKDSPNQRRARFSAWPFLMLPASI